MLRMVCAIAFMVYVLFMTVGCLSFRKIDPEVHGRAVGTALYASYKLIARRQSPEFSIKLEDLWACLNSIDSTDHLSADIVRLTSKFDSLITTKGLSSADREVLCRAKLLVLSDANVRLTDTAEDKEHAIKFLVGVKTGVNTMIVLENDQHSKK